MKTKVLILYLFLIILSVEIKAQTPGMIVEPASNAAGKLVFDPNGDGYVSVTDSGFQSNDISESEIPFVGVPLLELEPHSEILSGPNCKFTDFVVNNSNPAQAYLSPANNWIFRFRLGGYANNSKGYSILIDTDQKFGFTGPNADLDAVVGNPGFEIEISLQTNFGVYVYDVNGTKSPSLVASYPGHQYYSKSLALTTTCNDPDYFYDCYIPFSTISSNFAGVTSSTPMRMVYITVMNPAPAIGNNADSDIAGVDESNYGGSWDNMFTSSITNFYPTSPTSLNSGTPLARSECPSITGPIISGATSVSGSSNEATGTVIEVFKNGSSQGTTVVQSGGVWLMTGLTALVTNDIIKATAIASGKTVSVDNCDIETVISSCENNPTPPVSATLVTANSKGVCGTNNNAGYPGAVINVYDSTGVLLGDGSTYTVDVNGQFSWKCNASNKNCNAGSPCVTTDVVFVTQTFNGCESARTPFSVSCNKISADPIITSPILSSDNSVSGTHAVSGTIIYFYKNGVFQESMTVTGASTPFVWSFSGLTLKLGDSISVYAIETGNCKSAVVSTIVSSYTVAPVITGTYCSISNITSISGTSSANTGDTIKLYNASNTFLGSTTVNSNGGWTVTGLNLAGGTQIKATAQGIETGMIESVYSDIVTIGTKSTNTVTITTSTIVEGASSVGGSGTNNDVITLYADGIQIGSTTIVSGGVWTIGSLGSYDLYTDAVVTATATTGSGCEGDESAPVIVQCQVPNSALTISPTDSTVCEGERVSIQIQNSEDGVIYQLFDGIEKTGSSILGNGGNIDILSFGLISSTTLTINASKSGGSCSNDLSSQSIVTVENCDQATLPVDLISFDAKYNHHNNNVIVEWQTASELNCDRFILERGVNIDNMTEIANISGSGNSSTTKSYSYVDEKFESGINYYRLIQVDYDGNSKIFGPQAVTINNMGTCIININPVKDYLFISKNDNSEKCHVEIYSSDNRLLLSQTIENVKETTTISVPLYDLTFGTYYYSLTTKTYRCSGRFIKVK